MLTIVDNKEDYNIYFDQNRKCLILHIFDDEIKDKITNHINEINPSLKYDNDLTEIDEVIKEVEIALSK